MTSKTTKESVLVFTLSLAVYIACAAGYYNTFDGASSVKAATALLESGRLGYADINHYHPFVAFRGEDGLFHTKMGVTTVLAFIPFVAMGEIYSALTGWPSYKSIELFSSFSNSFVTALIVVILFRHFRGQNKSFRWAAGVAAFIGFATELFPYAKTVFRDPLEGLLILITFLALSRAHVGDEKARQRQLTIAGVAAFFLINTKFAAITLLVPALLLFPWQKMTTREKLIFVVLPVIAALAVIALIDWQAGARIFSQGYRESAWRLPDLKSSSATPWKTPFWSGMYIQLMSPQKSFYFYSPILIIPTVLAIQRAIQKKLSRMDIAVILTFFIQAMVYAKWFSPGGFGHLPPRYMITVIPLFGLLMTEPFQWPTSNWNRRVITGLSAFLILISVATQMINVTVNMRVYPLILKAGLLSTEDDYNMPHWQANIIIFWNKINGLADRYYTRDFDIDSDTTADLTANSQVSGLDFWYLYLERSKKDHDFHFPVPTN